MNPLLLLLAIAIGIAIGATVGAVIFRAKRSPATNARQLAESEAARLRTAAQAEIATLRKTAEIDARDQALKHKAALEEDLSKRKEELATKEAALAAKLRDAERQRKDAERKEADLKGKERSLEGRQKQAEAAVAKAEEAQKQAKERLEQVAGLSADQAKAALEQALRGEAQAGVAAELKRIEDEAAKEAHARSRTIIAAAIARYASEFVHERTVSVIPLPSDDLKGRLIGREGRNIRALEAATGIDLIIDDTAEAISISCFNPMRREVARLAISSLVADGRIHPTRIEESVKKAEKEVDKSCKAAGEQACFDLGIHRVHPELVKTLGSLKFRSSYAQNVLHHSIEVAYLAGLMAAELGINVKLARRAGLLHDIGRAIDHEHEGDHGAVGADFARKHNESPRVCQAIRLHHSESSEMGVLEHVIAAANSLSAQRPGARRETLASYVKRLEDLEKLCQSFEGVDRVYALQAGREVRVMVENASLDDAAAMLLAKDIAKSIEQQAAYAGGVRVVVVRETRASDYAR
ncbi:MAG: ribonuclease Y [Myxococcales bacterium]|nr:ribonuclease Y [Myxococcales bacterium]